MLQASLSDHERALGEEHPRTLGARSSVATLYSSQGKWSEAESLHRRCFEGDVRVFGREHPTTLLAMALLAEAISNQGRCDEAEALLRSSLGAARTHPRSPTPDDPVLCWRGLPILLAARESLAKPKKLSFGGLSRPVRGRSSGTNPANPDGDGAAGQSSGHAKELR